MLLVNSNITTTVAIYSRGLIYYKRAYIHVSFIPILYIIDAVIVIPDRNLYILVSEDRGVFVIDEAPGQMYGSVYAPYSVRDAIKDRYMFYSPGIVGSLLLQLSVGINAHAVIVKYCRNINKHNMFRLKSTDILQKIIDF